MLGKNIRIMQGLRSSTSARYWFCIAMIVVATFIRWLLNPILGAELPYIVLYFVIMLISWVGGLGPAMLGVALGIVTADFFFIDPRYTILIAGKHHVITTGLFGFIGIATGAMSGAYRRALASSERAYALSLGQQAELQQIYASTPVGLGFLDENLRYLRVNNALATFNGVPTEAHTGRHIREVLSSRIVEQVEPLLLQVLRTNNPVTNIEFEGPLAPKNEETRYVRASFFPVQLGQLKGIQGLVEDITEHKKAQANLKAVEDQLRHSVKMEAIGRLAGGLAHDFNNLLMVISSSTELLLEQLREHPTQIKKLNAIAGAAQRAARLTRQLLAFSRRQTLQPQVLELDPLIHNFEQLLRTVITENVELLLELNSQPAKIKVDPSQLEQVLMNLAVNARDAMPSGGRLVIHTRVRRFEQDAVRAVFTIPAGEYVEISMSDSGRGMSPEVQARIFDPFFTTKESGQGTGLGLSMVYGIVKQSGGYVEVQSAPDQGTTFRIWVPATNEASTPTTMQLASAPKGTGTILVAEDEVLLRQAIAESLTALGYRVLEAPDGADALAIVEANPGNIDLLLSDAVMPRMGGLDLIHRVREAYPAIKTVLMSGYANAASREASPDQNAQPDKNIVFLQKPFAHSELGKVVRQLLSNSLPV